MQIDKLKQHIGMDLRNIKLVPYDPAWAEIFEFNKSRLMEILGDLDDRFEIHHIGSTAIPTIKLAKPIIDITIRTEKDWETHEYNGFWCDFSSEILQRIENAGFYTKGDADSGHGVLRAHVYDPQNRNFVYNTIHTSQFQYEDAHLLFKRYMLEHPDEAERYSKLKAQSADTVMNEQSVTKNYYYKKKPENRFYDYCNLKDKFVEDINRKAHELYGKN